MEIQMKHICKAFSGTPVLQDVTVGFQNLHFTAILGPSGCGKTTLLRTLAGLEAPDTGEIVFDTACVFSSQKKTDVPPHRRGVGMVFQDFALWPHMTVFENAAFPLRAARQNRQVREKVFAALSMVQLSGMEDRYPQALSGGQQQRVAIARAIVGNPNLLLFDEPFSSLDAKLREEMRVELLKLVSGLRITTVFVTHDQNEAMSMADRLIVLQGGRVLQAGTPEELYRRPSGRFVADFFGRCNLLPDQAHMLRPEQVQVVKPAEAKINGVVQACLYLGERYELRVRIGDVEWRLFSLQKYMIGETVGLAFAEKDIVSI
ncbi:MAG: ABC transporter ATP-binding protein [Ethanoligenens sp.]